MHNWSASRWWECLNVRPRRTEATRLLDLRWPAMRAPGSRLPGLVYWASTTLQRGAAYQELRDPCASKRAPGRGLTGSEGSQDRQRLLFATVPEPLPVDSTPGVPIPNGFVPA